MPIPPGPTPVHGRDGRGGPSAAPAPAPAARVATGGRAASRARIGLLGGTFDPPHCGHMVAAEACKEALALDRVLLVVAHDPWQKADRDITPALDRLAMVEAAVEGRPGLEASRMEIDRGGPTYTVETVEEIRRAAEAADAAVPEVFLIVGSDLVPGLGTWKRSEQLRRLVTLVVVSRPGSPRVEDPSGWGVVHVPVDGVDVSSSEVRRRLEQGGSVGGLVPDAVIRCIGRRGLYAVRR